jgi:hypothetical protein
MFLWIEKNFKTFIFINIQNEDIAAYSAEKKIFGTNPLSHV